MVVFLRMRLIPAMDRIGAEIQTSESTAIREFRRVHAVALAINLGQLILLVWALTRFSF
jgi:hypothetical protein